MIDQHRDQHWQFVISHLRPWITPWTPSIERVRSSSTGIDTRLFAWSEGVLEGSLWFLATEFIPDYHWLWQISVHWGALQHPDYTVLPRCFAPAACHLMRQDCTQDGLSPFSTKGILNISLDEKRIILWLGASHLIRSLDDLLGRHNVATGYGTATVLFSSTWTRDH